MRRILLGISVAGFCLSLSMLSPKPASANLSTTLDVPISSQTRTLDLGPSGTPSAPDNGWNGLGFDDSTWDHAIPVAPSVVNCIRGYIPSWGNSPTYWSRSIDWHLFRQTFTLPQADNYDGSTIDVGTLTAAGLLENPASYNVIYINGIQIDRWHDRGLRRDPIGAQLQPGQNVFAMFAAPTNDLSPSGGRCNGITFTIRAHVNGISVGPPSPNPAPPVNVILPGHNATLTGSKLPFTWNAYRGAAYYDLQFWLVHAAKGQKLTSRSVTNVALRLRGTSYVLSTKAMPKGMYQWRMAAADKHGSLISSWTNPESVTLEYIRAQPSQLTGIEVGDGVRGGVGVA